MSRGEHAPIITRNRLIAGGAAVAVAGVLGFIPGCSPGGAHKEQQVHFGAADIDNIEYPQDFLAVKAHGHGSAKSSNCTKLEAPKIPHGGFLNDISGAITSVASAPVCYASEQHASGVVPAYMYLMMQGSGVKLSTYDIEGSTAKGVKVTVNTDKLYPIISKDTDIEADLHNGAHLPSMGGGDAAAKRIDGITDLSLRLFQNNCQNDIASVIEPGIKLDTKALLINKSQSLLVELGDKKGADLLKRVADRDIKVIFTHTADDHLSAGSPVREISAFQIKLPSQDTSKDWLAKRLNVNPDHLSVSQPDKPDCTINNRSLGQVRKAMTITNSKLPSAPQPAT